MKTSSVVIKGNKSGMTVIMDSRIPFEQLIADVAEKFHSSAKFWGSVQMTLTLEGRELTADQELAIVSTITENSDIEVLCLIDTDAKRIERCEKALNDKLMDLSAQTGQFYRGNLQDGDSLESEASIVVIGDVLAGARVLAKGNIIVLGDVRGIVHAGITGNDAAVVAGFTMMPSQLRIAGYGVGNQRKGRKLCRGAGLVFVKDGRICTKSLQKSIFDQLNFN